MAKAPRDDQGPVEMSESEVIAAFRQLSPLAIRKAAQIARETTDNVARKGAISQLVARRFLTTHHPSDEDLQRIEDMTDAEILKVLAGNLH